MKKVLPYFWYGLLTCGLFSLFGIIAANPSSLASSPDSARYVSERQEAGLVLRKVIKGQIQPKSVAHSGTGRFFVQNMMYQHSITVYDRNYNLIKTISDRVRMSDYGITGYSGWHNGAPVECAFSPDGKYAFVTNYKMYGQGFDHAGADDCDPDPDYDPSFLYKINTQSLEVEQLIKVGGVPKYVAVTPDGSKVLVANWCTGDLSIVDVELGVEIKRITLGRFPRGIAIDSKSRFAYICMMGEARLAKIRLSDDFTQEWVSGVGETPRHIVMSPDDRYLYISLNQPGKIVRYDLVKESITAEVSTGAKARSMVMPPEGNALYVVNYDDFTLSKVLTGTFKEVQEVPTNEKPIGVTFDPETRTVWVACYSGSIMVFEDTTYVKAKPEPIRDLGKVGPLAPKADRDRGLSYAEKMRRAQLPPASGRIIYRKREPTSPTNLPPVSSNQLAESAAGTEAESIPAAEQSLCYIIVANLQTEPAAQRESERLKALGYAPSVLPGPNGSYRVSCWSFKNRADAEVRLPYLKKSFQGAWIHQP